MVVIRNQLQMFETLYWQYLRNGGNYSPKKYFNHYFYKLNYKIILRYLDVLDAYASTFSNIIVLPFELFQNNPSEFVDTFSNMLSIDFKVDTKDLFSKENVKLKPAYYPLIRFINLFTNEKRPKRLVVAIPKLTKFKRFIIDKMQSRKAFIIEGESNRIFSDDIYATISSEFAESNLLLSQRYNLPLKELGYPTKL